VAFPAETRSLPGLCSAVGQALAGTAADDGCTVDLHLASDELASVLIGSATPQGTIDIEATCDDRDAYVRMAVTAEVLHLPTVALTRLLLDATADSYDLSHDGGVLVGVLQRALDSRR
jgi:hypothetical protein